MREYADDDVTGAGIRGTMAQIRFGLSQLAARNGQHEFEEMARFLARQTVCLNILPATGPVSAGGDQGRDFETFRTYVAGQVLPLGSSLGIVEGGGLAFACTLQSDNIDSKISSDVKKIVSQGTRVEHVVYYCEANVPVGRRHPLQAMARETYGVHLEIFDGTAIAELLSQRHLYWIAEEFLHLPAAALPPGPERPDWYESDLRRWREDDHLPTTPGDLVDLSGCLRYATFHEEARADLPFWIERMAGFLRGGIPNRLEQKARYEIAVAQLRGLGDLRPTDDLVATYMEGAVRSSLPSDLSDAGVLLMYCVGARGRGLTGHDEARLREWNYQLQAQIITLLETTAQPGRRCALLETLGWLRSHPDLIAARDAGIAYELGSEVPRLSLDAIEKIAQRGLANPVRVPLVDLAGAFDAWVEITDLLGQAPLFPVEQLAQMLRISAHMLVEDKRYDRVVTAVDARIAEVAGSAAAASNARDRALTFYRNGHLLDALRDIHRARIGWFSGETCEGMLLAALMTSQIYRELWLPTAAKYVAMTAALLADEHDMFFSRACFKAAEADYHQAAWFSSVALADLALQSHLLFADDPNNLEHHGHLQYAFFELLTIRGVAMAVGDEYATFVSTALEHTRINEVLDDLIEDLEFTPWWESLARAEIAQHISEQLGQPAFSDGGKRRSLTWMALGVTWQIEFANDYASTIVGERLAAFAQITLAEMAAHDPVLLPTKVVFEVEACAETDQMAMESRAETEGICWQVRLPQAGARSRDAIRKVSGETLTVVMSAISHVSVLPQAELKAIFDRIVSQGLLDKLTPGMGYDVAYGHLIQRSAFEAAPRAAAVPLTPVSPPRPQQAVELMPNGAGAHYDRDLSLELVRERYENIPETLVATLPALRSHAPFLEVVQRLRATGWKDWHILLAVFNVAQNNRFQFYAPRTAAEAREYFKLFMRPEEPGKPAPLELFTETALREGLRYSWLSTLRKWDLEVRQNPIDIQAVENLLAKRYSYWLDDCPHDDPFFPASTPK